MSDNQKYSNETVEKFTTQNYCTVCDEMGGHQIFCSELPKCRYCKILVEDSFCAVRAQEKKMHHRNCQLIQRCKECRGIANIGTIGHLHYCTLVPHCEECGGRTDKGTHGHNEDCKNVPKCIGCNRRSDKGWSRHLEKCSEGGCKIDKHTGTSCNICLAFLAEDGSGHHYYCTLEKNFSKCEECTEINRHSIDCTRYPVCRECGGNNKIFIIQDVCSLCGGELYL